MRNINKLLIVGFVTLSLTACAQRQNATTGEYETSSKTKGALGGCVAGAVIGGIIDDGKGAAIGCATAGGIGLAVGAQMDKQEAQFRQELLNSGVQVKRNGEQIELLLDGDITFSTGKSDISSAILPSLRSISKIMNEYPETTLIVEGHTDSVGSESSNALLSQNRAQSVQTELNKSGLSRSRTETSAYGEGRPRCSNDTEQGRKCNRRVELIIVPK